MYITTTEVRWIIGVGYRISLCDETGFCLFVIVSRTLDRV